MTIILSIIVIVLIVIMIKMSISNKAIKVRLQEDLVNLEKKSVSLYDEIESNKSLCSKDRQILIAKHEAESVELKWTKEKLAKFSQEQSLYYQEMDNLNNFSKEMSPEELLQLHSKVDIAGSGVLDFTGIYILENKTMNKYYVGQSITVIRRCAKHFMEKGNEDIYKDYNVRGEIWTIKLIALSNSGFKSINALEKHFIEYHHSTYNGYNRTVGNRT